MASYEDLLQCFTQQIEFLTTSIEATGKPADSPEFESVLAKSDEVLVKVVAACPSLSTQQTTKLMQLLSKSPYSMAVRSKIIDMMYGKIASTGEIAAIKANEKPIGYKNQVNLHLHRYFSSKEWSALKSPQTTYLDKLSIITNKFEMLGCTCPSEPTEVHACAILTLVGLELEAESLHVVIKPAECLHKLRDLKAGIKVLRGRVRLPHYGVVRVYPPTWQELRSQYPDVFAHAFPEPDRLPAECPLNEKVLDQLRMRMPARSYVMLSPLSLKSARLCK